MIETRTNPYNKPKSETCNCANPKPGGTCCNLVCFERPNYFCGHLLTDSDLSKEQQYFIEKNKLHNRTLHGSGVVCGLRLTCDDQCGGILIEKGYAIDDCGNDLVVCESQRFDILGALKDKGLLIGKPDCDPCKPDEEQPDCDYPQCFYVAVCYKEEPGDFTTPFTSGCGPALTECEPTRIREGVWFDVLDELPAKNDWLEDLRQRLEGCFCLFTKGAFAKRMQDSAADLTKILEQPANTQPGQYDDLYYQLRGLFLLFLKKYPDKYNCNLTQSVLNIMLPSAGATGSTQVQNYGQEVQNAFCNLFRLAWQYAISCAFGELVPRCPAPAQADCVVLGSVEVRNGCVTHVCNCPRSYVWSFANFFQVLIATLMGEAACKKHEDNRRDPASTDVAGVGATVPNPNDNTRDDNSHPCCAEFDFDCRDLLRLLKVNSRSLNYAGTETIRSFSMLAKSFKEAINFAQPKTFSPAIFQNMTGEQLSTAAELLNIKLVQNDASGEAPFVPFVDALDRMALGRAGESALVAEVDKKLDKVINAYAVPLERYERTATPIKPPPPQSTTAAAKRWQDDLEARVAKAEEFINNMKAAADPAIAEMRQKIQELTRSPESTPETPEAPKKKSGSKTTKPDTPEGEAKNG